MAASSPPSLQPTRHRSRALPRLQRLEGAAWARRIEHQAPWLASLHRLSTRALAALGLTLLVFGALSQHWQREWARSFDELQKARALEHRLQESAALLERHHLDPLSHTAQMVPTISENLIHLSEPPPERPAAPGSLLARIEARRMPAGY